MKWLCGLFLLVHFLTASAETEDFSLPSSKVYIESCHNQALSLHQGVITNEFFAKYHGKSSVRYEIQMNDGSEWIVQCSLENGKIIRDIHVDNDF